MARPKLKAHSFTIGTKRVIIKLPDVYDSTGYTVGGAFGISKLAADYTQEDNDDHMTVSEGLKNGEIAKIRISYKENGKSKSARLVCPVAKIAVGLNAVVSKTYKSLDVESAGIPRRRRLG